MKGLFFAVLGCVLLVATTYIVNKKLCQSDSEVALSSRHSMYSYEIDTLSIHGAPHEFIQNIRNGALCHSPECWCFDEYCPD